MIASNKGYLNIVQELLKNGADLDAKNNHRLKKVKERQQFLKLNLLINIILFHFFKKRKNK